MLRLIGYTLLLLFAGSCTRISKPFAIRYATKDLRAPGVSSMSCYFVSVTAASLSAPAEVPACLGLGRVSSVLTWDELTSKGASLRVPVASKMKLSVFGVYAAGGCPAGATVESLFSGTRPALYELGFAEATFKEGGSADIPDTYVAGTTPNLGSCGLSQVVHLTQALPTTGLHRGGLEMTITGTGFDAGAVATVGGVACVPTSAPTDTEIKCMTPNIAAQMASVAVTGATSTDVLVSAYNAFQVVLVTVNDSTSNKVLVYRQDPATGQLTQLTDVTSVTATFNSLVVHPSGKWVVSSHGLSNLLRIWGVDLSTGTLTSSSVAQGLLGNPTKMAFNPSGTHLYTNLISTTEVSPTGPAVSDCAFSSIACGFATPLAIEAQGRDVFVTPNGNFLYSFVIATQGFVDMFSLVNGALTGPVTRVVPLGTAAEWAFFNPVSVNPVLIEHLVTSSDPEFRVAKMDPSNGGSTSFIPPTYPLHGPALRGGAVTATSIYLLHGANLVRRYPLDPGDGTPQTTFTTFSPTGDFTQFAADPDGKYLFLTQDASTDTLQVFANTQPGWLPSGVSPLQTINIGSSPSISDLTVN